MWKWQVCDAIALGLPGQELVSDRVTGMHTGHPDEAVGNTLFHHSFSVTFLKVRNPDVIYANSVVYGAIHNAAGRTAQLLRGGIVVAAQVVAADETFRFANLGAGEYLVAVADTQLRSTPVWVNGQDQAHLDLTLVSAESVIAGRIHNGLGRILWLTRDGARDRDVARRRGCILSVRGPACRNLSNRSSGDAGHIGTHHIDGDGQHNG